MLKLTNSKMQIRVDKRLGGTLDKRKIRFSPKKNGWSGWREIIEREFPFAEFYQVENKLHEICFFIFPRSLPPLLAQNSNVSKPANKDHSKACSNLSCNLLLCEVWSKMRPGAEFARIRREAAPTESDEASDWGSIEVSRSGGSWVQTFFHRCCWQSRSAKRKEYTVACRIAISGSTHIVVLYPPPCYFTFENKGGYNTKQAEKFGVLGCFLQRKPFRNGVFLKEKLLSGIRKPQNFRLRQPLILCSKKAYKQFKKSLRRPEFFSIIPPPPCYFTFENKGGV